MSELVFPFLCAAAANMTMFALVWIFATRIKNAGVVDVCWAFSFFMMQSLYFLLCPGWLPRRAWLLALVACWSLRLTGYLFARTKSHHPVEDARYAEFRNEWQEKATFNFFFMFQFQAIVAVAMTPPFLLGSSDPSTSFHVSEYAGMAFVLLGFIGESIADSQLTGFKAHAGNKGQVCNVGLWRYSRHPNYFFEWIIWLGFGIFAFSANYGYLALIAPAVMYCFLRYISGVPPAEKQSLKSRGDLYRAYQATTSVFFPWFPKVTDRGGA